MNYYKDVIKRYAEFSGRARRKEYWMFVLLNVIISIIISIIDKAAGWNISLSSGEIGVLSLIYSLFIIIPSLAVSVRRMHDIDKSGWTLLFVLIPVVGSIILLVLHCKAGTAGENRYGSDPKETVE